jgi:MoxR-like ATPase
MKLSQAQQIISASVESNMAINGWSSKRIVPMLWGIPGLGKSTIVRAVADLLASTAWSSIWLSMTLVSWQAIQC